MQLILIYRLLFVVATGIVVLSAGCSANGTNTDDGPEPPNADAGAGDAGADTGLRAAAEEAYTLARDGILSGPLTGVDRVWNVQRMLESSPDPELEAYSQSMVADLAGDGLELLVNPEAARSDLPEDPGSGLNLLRNYILAPVGQPQERAIDYMAAYLSSDGSGYVLTHQILVIAWAAQTGLELPTSLTAELQPLLERLSAEQANDASFSDLYAERAALLLLYGDPSFSEASDWVDTIVEAQSDDGAWDGGGTTVSFDGVTVTAASESSHTTTWSMLALRLYLDRF